MTRIIMANDHSLLPGGPRKLVEEEGEVVGTVEDDRALIEGVKSCSRIIFRRKIYSLSRKEMRQSDRSYLKRLHQDAGISYVPAHGGAETPFDCRAHQVCRV